MGDGEVKVGTSEVVGELYNVVVVVYGVVVVLIVVVAFVVSVELVVFVSSISFLKNPMALLLSWEQ